MDSENWKPGRRGWWKQQLLSGHNSNKILSFFIIVWHENSDLFIIKLCKLWRTTARTASLTPSLPLMKILMVFVVYFGICIHYDQSRQSSTSVGSSVSIESSELNMVSWSMAEGASAFGGGGHGEDIASYTTFLEDQGIFLQAFNIVFETVTFLFLPIWLNIPICHGSSTLYNSSSAIRGASRTARSRWGQQCRRHSWDWWYSDSFKFLENVVYLYAMHI